MKSFFYVRDFKLHKYLQKHGFKYICEGFDTKRKKHFFQYQITDELQKAINNFKADRNFHQNNKEILYSGNWKKKYSNLSKYISLLFILNDFAQIHNNSITAQDLDIIGNILNKDKDYINKGLRILEQFGFLSGADDDDKIWCWHIEDLRKIKMD